MVEATAPERQSLGNIPADQDSTRGGSRGDLIVNAHTKADPHARIMQERRVRTTANVTDTRPWANVRERYSEAAPSYETIEGGISHFLRVVISDR